MNTLGDELLFNDLMRRAYKANPRLFARLMRSPEMSREIYIEMMRSPVTAFDLTSRGYKEPTVYRNLKNLMQMGLITSSKIERRSQRGSGRIFLWRIR